MKTPRGFFKPLAIGAPMPLRELPVRVERMIHFVPPHLDKLRAKVNDIIAEGKKSGDLDKMAVKWLGRPTGELPL